MLKKIPNITSFKTTLVLMIVLFTVILKVSSQETTDSRLKQWTVNGVLREAMIYIPNTAKTKPTSVVFAFHGHGGTMINLMRNRNFERLWPEAIIVYPQGLNTPGQLTDPAGKLPGWQNRSGDMDDRDLNFFDTMLKSLHHDYEIDDSRIYATGHSNGGGFTYLLWATRGEKFAAFAPSATVAGKNANLLKPKPAMHIIGENDPLVKPKWQIFTYQQIMKLNSCEKQGENYAENATIYQSKTGNPFVLYQHKGNHKYPQEADEVVIKFFKSVVKSK
ncbi:PHB depolymerase family esterase [Pedobacter sp. Leaf250]|uniref:alpha/beta hydrolase family esterase n=1 Tax=Pedobacter sp. Leaf250 TaxID=2876559 RepID=UPI001E2D3900|nr:esterase [Pedobacter sp. Leaf250]